MVRCEIKVSSRRASPFRSRWLRLSFPASLLITPRNVKHGSADRGQRGSSCSASAGGTVGPMQGLLPIRPTLQISVRARRFQPAAKTKRGTSALSSSDTQNAQKTRLFPGGVASSAPLLCSSVGFLLDPPRGLYRPLRVARGSRPILP
jgi:hypothetical protein